VLPQALAIIVLNEIGPKGLGHRAFTATVLLQQFFEPILGLRVAHAVDGPFLRFGEDVRRAEWIAEDGDLFVVVDDRAR
jgi:hypothetical protein